MKKQGFTLIELLAVIVILGIIMAIAIPGINMVINNARKNSFVREADGTDWRGSDQGTQLKAVVHDGTNTVGFNALLTGYHQYNTNGTPANSETWSYWWSSTYNSATGAWRRDLGYTRTTVNRSIHIKSHGFSVRCVLD